MRMVASIAIGTALGGSGRRRELSVAPLMNAD
jgi:hypothetical protein